ncbi:winged helix-turn-helix domain-containing protein [Vibrio sp. F74]|uniref:winged helix-turn-helix domain-containing protein n=1 Tax=Vibrio sp. F74 TaxID=700020 RepID=UPI0035F5CDDB
MSSALHYQLGLSPEIIFTPEQHLLVVGGEICHLEPLQSRMLTFFIQHQGEVLNTKDIASQVWERSQVSDNLVRQVISILRSQLQDKSRPYSIIKTIPKQGYLFDIDVIVLPSISKPEQVNLSDNEATNPELETNKKKEKTPYRHKMAAVLMLFLAITLASLALYWQDLQPDVNQPSVMGNQIIPVVFHDIVLDKNQDFTVARSVYEYIFFGLNSSKNIVGYRYSQLTPEAIEQIKSEGIELKSWIKQTDSGYVIKMSLENHRNPESSLQLEQRFTIDNFFSPIGDLILDVKTRVVPVESSYNVASHRITSIQNYDDWRIIAKGISLFYQGKGFQELDGIEKELVELREQGRDYYLLDSLGSYISSMRYLNQGQLEDKHRALTQANQAFEKNPRCNIANTTLGLALLLNDRSEQAYPYLFYASENSPSPLSYYLLSIADQQSNNPRGAEYNYQRFSALNKSDTGQLFGLNEYLQKPNLFDKTKSEH